MSIPRRISRSNPPFRPYGRFVREVISLIVKLPRLWAIERRYHFLNTA